MNKHEHSTTVPAVQPKTRNQTPRQGQIINVQAYKYDGLLYRQWNGVKVLRNTDDHYVLFMYRTKIAEAHKRNWLYLDPVLWFLPKQEMANALVLLKRNQKYIYTNIASAPLFEDNTLKFIDFDIDIKKYPGKQLEIIDGEEFVENTKKYCYPPALLKLLSKALDQVIKHNVNNEYYYNDLVIDYYVELAKKDKLFPLQHKHHAQRRVKTIRKRDYKVKKRWW
ncbi:DUF402 domain-containing protein [Mycoplasmopsis columbinasalis]|uniref:Protein of uncharacterized function (DUF402) n=1 Tax=Mycoplasmopsis columbinasalis TaxID=114880 RepID=A0A449BAP2_9BACT|nr:DUF402 domain-containing protein [Mycoplasmopsis columbinasalis]VEU78256.1 Protein of uncharacterised function (DUF402) [Mycoplasmopsis columbinasalis]